jgi:hypothetical protein
MPIDISQVFTGNVTGGGFTASTYTTTDSSTTIPNGKVAVVTAEGGTNPAAVDVHSASRPFSIAVLRPPVVRILPPLNAAGILPNVPINQYTISVRKGMTPLAGQASVVGSVEIRVKIPAGCDLADPANVGAMIDLASSAFEAEAENIRLAALSGEI